MGGLGAITKTGNGRLELAGDDTFTGPLSASAGELFKTGSGSQSGTTVSGNAVLRVSHSGAFGAGGLTISAANTSTGRLELSGGVAVLAGKGVSINSRSSNTDAVSSLSGDNTFGGNVSLGTGGSLYGLSSAAGLLTLSGSVSSAATGNRNFTLRGAGDGRMTGTVADGSGIVGIIKSGSGTWTLAGTHSFTGAVAVQEGALNVASPLPLQAVTVSTGAALSGVGALGGAVTIAGTHSPGDGVGTQAVTGTLTYQSTARIQWEIAAQSLTADKVQAAEVTVLPGALVQVTTNSPGSSVNFTDPFWRASRQWPVLSATTLGGSFSLGANPVDSSGRPSLLFGSFSLVQSPSGVNLVWTPAPPFQIWQYENFAGAWNDPLIAGPDRDPDGDGWTNNDEWITGSVPNNPTSAFRIAFAMNGISFTKIAGRLYRVETATDLNGGWTTHTTLPSGSGPVTVPVLPGNGQRRFYRVAVAWAP